MFKRRWKVLGFLFCGIFLISFIAKAAIDHEQEGVEENAPVEKVLQITPVEDPNYLNENADDRIPCWGCNPWHPNGDLIVFQTKIDGYADIYNEICIIKVDGTGFKRLTNDGENPVCDSHASFTPDGKKIVWQRRGENDRAEIWIMNIDGTNKKNLTQVHGGPVNGPDTCETQPMISPDGTKIAFKACHNDNSQGGSIWVMNIDGSMPVKVSGNLIKCTKHSWSPDSQWILFNSRVDYDGDGNGDKSRIFKVRANATGLTMLSEDTDEDICENWANWSPDGKWISYHRRDWTGDLDKYGLWIMKPDGTEKRCLVEETDANSGTIRLCGPHSWSPDSKYIVFKKYYNTPEQTESPLFIVNIQTGEIQQLTSDYMDGRMWWSPNGKYILFKEHTGLSESRDGKLYDRDLLVLYLRGFEYTPSEGLCFIATAAYGSPFEKHVEILRQFRDKYLLTNSPGKAFVRWYYSHSPRYAKVIATSEPLKLITRILLIPVYLLALVTLKGILPYLIFVISTTILMVIKLKRV
ncbi:MAG: hypothetical protein NC922_05230 [Candidatus Omnitrophica bacterium]|nr:hypothetical protein [Candidatus Omnitrophota bacterium]